MFLTNEINLNVMFLRENKLLLLIENSSAIFP